MMPAVSTPRRRRRKPMPPAWPRSQRFPGSPGSSASPAFGRWLARDRRRRNRRRCGTTRTNKNLEPVRCFYLHRTALMGQKYRNGHLGEKRPGYAAEHQLSRARMAVPARDDQVRANVGGKGQKRLSVRDPLRNGVRGFSANAVAGEMQGDVGRDALSMTGGALPGVDRQDRNRLGLFQQRQRIIDRPRRLTAGIPGDQDALADLRKLAGKRNGQDRAA